MKRNAISAPLAAGFLPLLLLAVLPVLLVKIPPLDDYVNHLARMYIIAIDGRDPLLARFYAVEWHIVPNLAMDLIVPPLAGAFGIYAAGKIFILAYIGLIVTGVAAVHCAVFGRLSATPLLVFLFIYNQAHLYGNVNFLFGVGVALWGIAAWIALRGQAPWRRGLISLLFVLVLFTAHLFALGLYGLTLLAVELHLLRPGRRPRSADLAAFLLPFLVVPALMAMSPTSGFAEAVRWDWQAKFQGLWFAFKIYHTPLDAAEALLLAAAAFLAWRRRIVRLHPVGWWFAVLVLPVYLAMPVVLFGSWGADLRLPAAAAFILVAFLDIELGSVRRRTAFLAVVVGLSVLRFADVALVWRDLAQDFTDFHRSFEAIAPGSTILVADASQPGQGTYAKKHAIYYAPCLAIIEKSSFVPNTFSHPGKQPLVVRPPYHAISSPEGLPPTLDEVLAAARDPSRAHAPDAFWEPSGEEAGAPYWAHWPERFDYLYVLYTHDAPNPAPELLTLVHAGERFQLYKVKHPS